MTTERAPHTVGSSVSLAAGAGRFASLVKSESIEGCRVAILGLADDVGVRLNGGRPGAKEGPRAFRAALAKYGVSEPHGW